MFSKAIIAIIPAFVAFVLGAPTTDTSLAARSGNHFADVYSGAGCSGVTLDTEINFGCGVTCHSVSGIASVLLSQEGTGNPKPTASFFSDGNCQHQISSAGISIRGNIVDVPICLKLRTAFICILIARGVGM